MNLATNIHQINGNNWKGFQGQRLKVKVVGTPFMGIVWMWLLLVTRIMSMKLAIISIMPVGRTEKVVKVKVNVIVNQVSTSDASVSSLVWVSVYVCISVSMLCGGGTDSESHLLEMWFVLSNLNSAIQWMLTRSECSNIWAVILMTSNYDSSRSSKVKGRGANR